MLPKKICLMTFSILILIVLPFQSYADAFFEESASVGGSSSTNFTFKPPMADMKIDIKVSILSEVEDTYSMKISVNRLGYTNNLSETVEPKTYLNLKSFSSNKTFTITLDEITLYSMSFISFSIGHPAVSIRVTIAESTATKDEAGLDLFVISGISFITILGSYKYYLLKSYNKKY